MLTPDQLHDYQKKASNFQSTHPNSAIWADMGLGKTAITLTSIAHLLNAGFLRGTLIVAPIRVIRLVWRQEALKWSHTHHLKFSMVAGTKDQRTRALMQKADVYLINYENLKWLADTLTTYYIKKDRQIPFNGVVWDECFPAEVQVSTSDSDISIANVKIGDIVETHLGPRRVINTMRKRAYCLVTITLTSGETIRCTPNHPFMANGAWCVAGELNEGDLLHERTQHSTVRPGVLSNMWKGVLEKTRVSVHLFQRVRKYVANAATRDQEFNHQWWNKSPGETSAGEWCLEQREVLVRRDAIENERVSQEKRPFPFNWWEWYRGFLGRKSSEDGSARTIRAGVYPTHPEEDRRNTNPLQIGFRRSGKPGGNRGSGAVSYHPLGEDSRQEETGLFEQPRVVSVVHNQYPGGVDVWNLHVEEAETYFANGILVHNCSKMKNSTTKRVSAFRKILPFFDWTTGLTGTPAANGYRDLHGQYLVLDKGVRLGTSKTAFTERFYYKKSAYKLEAFPDTEETIKSLIGDITMQMSAEDYNPLPDLIMNDIRVDLPPQMRRKYEDLEKDFFFQLDNGTDVEVFNKASLTNKCIAEGTEVLTTDGWIPIEQYDGQMVWDGEEWVNTSGLSFNGYKYTINCHDVLMTPDHKVLTTDGWKEARDITDGESRERYDRSAVRLPDGYSESWEQKEEGRFIPGIMGSSLRLREQEGDDWSESSQEHQSSKIMWVQTLGSNNKGSEGERCLAPQYDGHASLCYMDQHEVPMQQPIRQRLPELWGKGYHCMRKVVRVICRFLGGHVQWVSGSPDHRENGQFCGVLSGELQMGNDDSSSEQSKIIGLHRHPDWSNNRSSSSKKVRSKTNNNIQKVRERGVRYRGDSTRRVYDIVNAGPRHRYTVRGTDGKPLIVHNCLQFSNGFVYPIPGIPKWEHIHDLKLDALEDIIEEAGGSPILCAYQYRADAERIMERFKKLRPINLTECKSEASLNNAMARWKNDDCQLMIGHPASMGHGVDGLQDNGHILVWFGLNWSLDLYLQFNARIRRQGQGAPVICHRILVEDTLDQAQALALGDKEESQTSLRNAIKAYRQMKENG
jgi:hypothetical protein